MNSHSLEILATCMSYNIYTLHISFLKKRKKCHYWFQALRKTLGSLHGLPCLIGATDRSLKSKYFLLVSVRPPA